LWRAAYSRDIGAEMNIGEGTVKVYLHGIYQKLNIDNRTELALLAISEPCGLTRQVFAISLKRDE
jgi:two-component system nitrate/nitrite response regulator NarP